MEELKQQLIEARRRNQESIRRNEDIKHKIEEEIVRLNTQSDLLDQESDDAQKLLDNIKTPPKIPIVFKNVVDDIKLIKKK